MSDRRAMRTSRDLDAGRPVAPDDPLALLDQRLRADLDQARSAPSDERVGRVLAHLREERGTSHRPMSRWRTLLAAAAVLLLVSLWLRFELTAPDEPGVRLGPGPGGPDVSAVVEPLQDLFAFQPEPLLAAVDDPLEEEARNLWRDTEGLARGVVSRLPAALRRRFGDGQEN